MMNTRSAENRLLIPRRNPFFRGRTQLIEQVHLALVEDPQASICVLSGLAGIGKTQIALEYAHQHRDAYEFIFWADASDPTLLPAAFKRFGGSMGIPYHRRRNLPSLLQEIHNWMRCSTNWLIVFDGAMPEAFLSSSNEAENISRFWPTAHRGKILITTRTCTDWYRRIDVPALQEDEAIDLLVLRAGNIDRAPLSRIPDGALQQIVADLAGIPLAIDQVVAWMSENGWTFSY